MRKILLVVIFLLFMGTIPVHAEETFQELTRKADSGNAEAQALLGEAYFCGWNGAPQDDKKAYECFEKSSAQGNIIGQYYMGTMYYFGKVVGKDYQKAFEYFEKAALQGEIRAQSHIAMMYSDGNDFPQDYVLACAYYNMAVNSAKDPMDKKNLQESIDRLQKKMTPAQIKEANEKGLELLKKLEEYKKNPKNSSLLSKPQIISKPPVKSENSVKMTNVQISTKTDEIFVEAVLALDIKMIKELINNGYKVNNLSSEYAPILISVIGSQKLDFSRLMGAKYKAVKGYTEESLKKEIALKKIEVFKLLAENGADLNAVNNDGEKLIALTAKSGNSEILKYLFTKKIDVTNLNQKGDNLLYYAVGSRSLETVKTVVESNYGADLIKSGARSAASAASFQDEVILKYLMEKGVNINGDADSSLKTLRAALINKNVAALKLLIEKGIDLTVISKNGENCLFELTAGVFGGKTDEKTVEMAKMLVAKGVDAAKKNNRGETVLMKAARNGNVPLMKYFIEKGVDVNARSNNGMTAVGYAKKEKREEAIAFLISINAVE